MTRYRLPDALGGMELPEDTGGVLDTTQNVEGVWLLRFDIPGVGRVRIQREALIEVAEPLPPEPPVLSIANFGDEGPFIRRTLARWQNLGGYDFEYADLCRFGSPVLLVPDPLAEAPDLPWSSNGADVRSLTSVEVNGRTVLDTVNIGRGNPGQTAMLTPELARAKGLALLRAAAVAEGPQPLPDWERELLEGHAAAQQEAND